MRGFRTARVSLCSFNGTSADNTSARLTRALCTLLLSPAYLRARGTRPALKTSPDRITITVELLPFPIIILCYYDYYCILLLLLLLDICSIRFYHLAVHKDSTQHAYYIIYVKALSTIRLRGNRMSAPCPIRTIHRRFYHIILPNGLKKILRNFTSEYVDDVGIGRGKPRNDV